MLNFFMNPIFLAGAAAAALPILIHLLSRRRFTRPGSHSSAVAELVRHEQEAEEALDGIEESAPKWMLNHRKDYETGEDIHLIGSDIDMRLRDEINIMKKIRSYKGIRHERGLPARGQRTRANNRSGLTLGVSKRREDRKK